MESLRTSPSGLRRLSEEGLILQLSRYVGAWGENCSHMKKLHCQSKNREELR